MTKSGWLKCSIGRGMFSDEVAVNVTLRNGAVESYFVPSTEVNQDRVRVSLRDRGPVLWATLPTSDNVTLAVDKSKIVG